MNHLSSLGQGKLLPAEEGAQPAHSQKGSRASESGHSFLNDRGIFMAHSSGLASSTFIDTQRRIEYSHDISKRAHRTP